MPVDNYINIATKAYQQAVKYEHVSREMRQELFHFIHDWFRQVVDENRAKEIGDETPNEMFNKSMEIFKKEGKK